ncbi:hypothetical protein [Clostridium botulinum]|nr:hypothetical protein [Clostridium botulinum]
MMNDIEIHENDIIFENGMDWDSFYELVTNIELIQEYKNNEKEGK